jgi:hypothetical protein
VIILSELTTPGTDNKPAGKYKEVGPHGGAAKNPKTVKIDSSYRLPLTQENGNKWTKK